MAPETPLSAFASWQEANVAKIATRLQEAAAASPGRLQQEARKGYHLIVIKTGTQVQLYFASLAAPTGVESVSGIMSRIDVRRPLHLLGVYTQAMVLSMLWTPSADRIYHIGFGGGRIPMVLHHYFPGLIVESAEIDGEVVKLARRWFGIEADDRMRVLVGEGRSYLSGQPGNVTYDAILVDCYTGSGQHPYSLSTAEFYRLCRDHLRPRGVVATNLAQTDPLFDEKWQTFAGCFDHVWRYSADSVDVFFGSDTDVASDELVRRAEAMYQSSPFTFPFRELLADLHPVRPSTKGRRVLSDEDGRRDALLADTATWWPVGRNEPCPCGSDKKFKYCHGQPAR